MLGDLEVGLLGDPLPGERAPELVVHHLDLLVEEDVRQVERRVRDRVVDDLVGELVARLVEGVALEPLLDPGPERRQVLEVTHRSGEVVVGVGQHLLAQLPQLDLEVGHLAGERRLRVVVGERDVEPLRVADRQPDEVVLEARDQAVLADDQRHPLGRPALERDAVAGALELDDRVVALLGAAFLDRREGRRSGRAAPR